MGDERDDPFGWLAGQLAARGPETDQDVSAVDQIHALVEAVATLERGGATVFGRHLDAETREALRPLAGLARDVIGQWREVLTIEHGEKGEQFVRTLAARGGITLPGMESLAMKEAASPPSDAEQQVFDALARGLEDGRARAGIPDPAALEDFAVRYEASEGARLPVGYLRLLARFDGVQDASEGERFGSGRVAPRQLGEPSLYPLEIEADHLLLTETELAGITQPFLFGGLVDSGHLVFDAAAPEHPVFWVPRHFSREPVAPLTPSFGAFLTLWAEAEFSVQAVLRRCRAPGWGG